MPKSKRDKKVSLTKVAKKGKELKQNLIENIRKHLDEFDNLYVFTVNNMRNGPLKEVREDWRGSRFFYAKRKVMAIALGRSEEAESLKNVHKVANNLTGQCGLLFTNKPKDYVVEWFQNYSKMDFAKSGFVATRTVTLPAGPLPDFSHAIEPHLRSLGLPTCLEKGVIVLRKEHTVCKEGARLTPEEASILKLLGEQMAEFKMSLVCMWSKDGLFEKFKTQKHIIRMAQSRDEVEPSVVSKKKKRKSKHSRENTENELPLASHEEIIAPMTNLTTSEPGENSDQDIEMPQESTNSPKKTKIPKKNRSDTSYLTNLENEHDSESEIEIPPEKIKASKKSNLKQLSESTTSTNLKPESESDDEVEIPTEKMKTPKNKTPKKSRTKLSSETSMDEDQEDQGSKETVSPHFGKNNLRRSMRTPKPIKRTPDQSKHSVKKLTVTASKVQKGTPRGTPKRLKD